MTVHRRICTYAKGVGRALEHYNTQYFQAPLHALLENVLKPNKFIVKIKTDTKEYPPQPWA